jgi:hypothetical protein
MTGPRPERRHAPPPQPADRRARATERPVFPAQLEKAFRARDDGVLPRGVFASLQSKYGNAAVARLARERGARLPDRRAGPRFAPLLRRPAPLRVDRKVGFEVETLVPILRGPGATNTLRNHPSGQAPPPELEQFLYGGGQQVQYGEDAGKVNGVYDVSADHAAAIYQPVKDIVAHLRAVGLSRQTPMQNDKRMSIIEYGTAAYDELAPGSNALFTTQFADVKNHLITSAASAKAKHLVALPVPAGAYYTGVPWNEFEAWLDPPAMTGAQQNRYNAKPAYRAKWDAWATIQPLLAQLQQNVEQDKTGQLQATVGIAPSAIGQLYANYMAAYVTNKRLGKSARRAATPVKREIDNLLASAPWTTDPYVQPLMHRRPRSYRALVGTLHLLYSYVAAVPFNAFHSSNVKNTVPFLIKLGDFGAIVAEASPPYLRAHPPAASAIQVVKDHLAASGLGTVPFWRRELGAKPHRAQANANPATFVEDMLSGRPVAAGFGPGATFAKPEGIRRTQKGVQVEYRHITDRPAAGGLDAVFWRIVDEVRDLNMDGLSAQNKATRRGRF